MYAFPRKKKSIFLHAETRRRNHGIRLVVARNFRCLCKFRSCTCVLHRYRQHAGGKVAHRPPRTGTLLARRNAFMKMGTEKCTRTALSARENEGAIAHMESRPNSLDQLRHRLGNLMLGLTMDNAFPISQRVRSFVRNTGRHVFLSWRSSRLVVSTATWTAVSQRGRQLL